MKPIPHRRPRRFTAFVLVALACAGAQAWAKPEADATSRVAVTWTNPADFADTRQDPGFGRQNPEEWLGQLAKHLQRRADRVLPPGQHLQVTFTDVKRAGTFEPWRGPQWDDVRIVKDLYPPRIDLHFTLTAADGAGISEGARSLRDPAFLSRTTLGQDDPLRYEKRLLDDWLRREFPAANARRD